MNVDYIVVGLGLAGIAFVEELETAGKSYIVFEDDSQNSSLVAGGVFNPVILKRFTPVWNGAEQLRIAKPFFKKLEQKLGKQFVIELATKKVLKSIEDQNNWFAASDKPMLEKFMIPSISNEEHKGVLSEFGFGELKGTGRIDTSIFINAYRELLTDLSKIIFERFDYNHIQFNKDYLVYKTVKSTKIVFCEGFGIKKNPFFNHLPMKEAKGELLTIHAPELYIDFLLKSTVFVLPLGNHYFKVGATFNWTDKTLEPSEDGKAELIEKLKKVIDVPYTIVNQTAGIRPTIKDRRPLVGIHHKYSQLAVLNGLGTRGVMIAPTVAKDLFNHLEEGADLHPEIDIVRFKKKRATKF